jgi:PAS domain S-box-containing protein
MLHPEDRERIAAAIRRAHDPAGDGLFDVEQRIIRPDGEVRWLVTRSQTFFEGEGDGRHPVRTVGAVLDATEWKRVEERLAEAQEIGGFGSFEVDVTTWVGHCSPALRRIFGLATEEPFRNLPAFLRRHVHADDRERTDRARAKLLEEGGSDEIEFRYLRPDGQERILRLRRRALRTVAGQVTRIVGTIQDVTELKRLEEQFRQAQKMEAVGRLAGGVAHDFNNLLTVINGYAALLLQDLGEGAPQARAAGAILDASEHAAALTRQLLTFARKQLIAPRALDLNAAVADAQGMLRRLIGDDIVLAQDLQPGLGHVRADPTQVQQVILNLAVNARDAMPRGGQLSFATRHVESGAGGRAGRYVLLAVADTGCGMTEEVKAHLFEPFFTTKGPGKGTGLGLSTVYGIIQQAGGHIEVESHPGLGTTFRVYLPRAEEPTPEAGPAGPRAVTPGRHTVLLAEDEDAVRALVRQVLQSSGCAVLEACDGAHALRLAAQHQGPIDLLVTDLTMPGLDGRGLAERLRTLRPGLRVLYLSGYTEDAAVRQAVSAESLDFLPKPFSPADLAQKVREVLDPPGTGAAVRPDWA